MPQFAEVHLCYQLLHLQNKRDQPINKTEKERRRSCHSIHITERANAQSTHIQREKQTCFLLLFCFVTSFFLSNHSETKIAHVKQIDIIKSDIGLQSRRV